MATTVISFPQLPNNNVTLLKWAIYVAAGGSITGMSTTFDPLPSLPNNDVSLLKYLIAAISSGGTGGKVSSVFGRTGAVVSAANDYSFSQLSGLAGLAQGGLNRDNSGTSTFTPAQGYFFDLVQTNTNYIEGILQNLSNAAAASTDLVLSNDVSTATTYYGNVGINSSGFTGSGSLNLASATYLTATSGELVLGTTTANGIRFVTNAGTTDAMALSSAGALTINGSETNTKSGAASVSAWTLSGSVFTGGTGTTTFPLALIQPTGATASTFWNTAGTVFAINYPSGFTGDAFAIKSNGGGSLLTFSQGNLIVSNVVTGIAHYFTSGGGFYGIGDGIIRISNNSATAAQLQFGNTTSAFPSLKRSSAVLQGRLADDSAFCQIQGILTTDTNATTGLGAGVLAALTNASITIKDASGQTYRIPCII